MEPARLDPDLLARTKDRYAGIREGAIMELAALLSAGPSIAMAAREALRRMTADDSRRVSARARAALEAAEDAGRPVADDAVRPAAAEAVRPAVAGSTPAVPPEAQLVAPRRRPGRMMAVVAAIAVVLIAGGIAIAGLRLLIGGDDGDGGGNGGRGAVIPTGNLVANPSFETDLRGWDVDNSSLTRERASDAPDGDHVVRVSTEDAGPSYSIEDSPDTVESSVEGRTYSAAAWVKATSSSEGELVCLAVRERTAAGEPVDQSIGGELATAGEYREVRASLVAAGSGNRIDVYVAMANSRAFLVDAISLAEETLTPPSGGC